MTAQRLVVFLTLLVLLPTAYAVARPLERFPVILHAGVSYPVASEDGPIPLPDAKFRQGSNYGHVGGEVRLKSSAVIFGGESDWPSVWRENPEKYTFQLSNGRYVLSLSFVETEVAGEAGRVFDVVVQDRVWIPRLDIFREAGDFRWLTVTDVVEVDDGWLDIEFRAHPDRRPPVIGRIEITPEEGFDAQPKPPEIEARGSYRGNYLTWAGDSSGATVGYGVFRAEQPSGPFEPITEYPVQVNEYVDRRIVPGSTYFYRVRAYGARGGQSPFSTTKPASSYAQFEGDLRVVDIRIGKEGLAQILDRGLGSQPVNGEIFFYGKTHRLMVSSLVDDALWQFKKAFRVRFDRRRGVSGFRESVLFSDVGDPTHLRRKVYFDLRAALELGAPRVDHVRLLLDGAYQGVFIEQEHLGRQYRDRIRVDAVGDFAAIENDGRLHKNWKPYGVPSDGAGSLWNLTLYVQELNRLNEGEMDEYVDKYLYLDRVLDKLALNAVTGVEHGEVGPRLFLGDSRNLRWEPYPADAPDGAFGVRTFRTEVDPRNAERSTRWSLFGPSLVGRRLPVDRMNMFEARLFNRPGVWKKYLDRVEQMLSAEAAPERVEELVKTAYAKIAPAHAEEPRAWPADGGGVFRNGPRTMMDRYRSHHQTLVGLFETARTEESSALVINEFLLSSAKDQESGTTWVEFQNRSKKSVSLKDYRLSVDPRQTTTWAFPDEELAPGEAMVVEFSGDNGPRSCSLSPSSSGGTFVLARVDSRGVPMVADAVFYGHQTAGISYARDSADGWSHVRRATPGEVNSDEQLSAPDWKYRWSLERDKKENYRIWIRAGDDVDTVTLFLRHPGQRDFEPLPMKPAEDSYGLVADVLRFEGDPRVPFYFLARSKDGIERPYPLTGSALPFHIPERPKLVINEVLPRPLRGNEHGEFVEIYNAGEKAYSLEGLYLTDKRVNPLKWRLPLTGMIGPGEFKVVYADGLGRGLHAPFKLSNGGEYLGLYHGREAGSLLVDHIAYAAVPANQSWGRERDGKKGGRVWKDPTPGRKNLPKIPEEYLRKKDDDKAPTEGSK